MPASGKSAYTGAMKLGAAGGKDHMANDRLASLAEAIGRHTPGDGGRTTAVPNLRLARASAPTDFLPVVYEASLCVVVQGSKEVRLAGETFRYDSAHSLLVSVDLPVTARVVEASKGRPCLVARVMLNAAVVGEFLADGPPPLRPGPPARALGVTSVEPPLLDAITRLVTLLDAPEDIPALAPLVLREITYRILAGPQGAKLRQFAAAGAPAHRIARAVQWLTDHYAEPLRVEELAKRVGMSPSALHLHFKHVTTLSPLQYQKRLRLQEARRIMLGEGLDAGGAAFRVGYESPSQFGREYRRMFGTPPGKDVAALRLEALPT
jgi:AraC-like DNA-binding protein